MLLVVHYGFAKQQLTNYKIIVSQLFPEKVTCRLLPSLSISTSFLGMGLNIWIVGHLVPTLSGEKVCAVNFKEDLLYGQLQSWLVYNLQNVQITYFSTQEGFVVIGWRQNAIHSLCTYCFNISSHRSTNELLFYPCSVDLNLSCNATGLSTSCFFN